MNEMNEIKDEKISQGVKGEKYDPINKFHYRDEGDDMVSVRNGEMTRWMNKKRPLIMGYYEGEDLDNKEHIWTEFETLLESVVIGQLDMFGQTHRMDKDDVIDIVHKVYNKNGWDKIYGYEKVEGKEYE